MHVLIIFNLASYLKQVKRKYFRFYAKEMSKYDFNKRLKRMVFKECEIVKLESKIARKSAELFEQLSSLKIVLEKQEQELSIFCSEVQTLKRINERLERCKQKKEERLCATIQKVEQMQSEYESTIQQQLEQRRTALNEMDCVRSIKKATQTYINMDVLPQRIQGVTICDKDTSLVWRPFCIDPLKHSQKEVQDMIWHDTQVDSVIRDTWEKLILKDVLRVECDSTTMV